MKFSLIAVLSLSFIASSHAATLANFQFTGNSLASADASTTWDTTDLTSGGGLPTTVFSVSEGNPTTPSLEFEFGDINSDSGTTSFDANDFYSFTITPDSGFESDFTLLSFDLSKQGTASVDWEIRSSVDGFGTALGSGGTSGTFTWNTNLQADLSGLANQSGTTEFRIFFTTTGSVSANEVWLDNLVLTGESVAIPEPSAAALLASFGALLLLRRRRCA